MKAKGKDYFQALYDVASVINASLDMTAVLEAIVKAVAEGMGVKACSIRLLDHRKRTLMMGAAYGLTKGYLRKGPVIVKESGLDQIALKGETIWIKDAQTDPNFQYGAGAKAEGIKSVLVVPLKLGKTVIGVLRVYSDKIREFNQDESRFVEAASNLSAIAIENSRYHELLKKDYDLLIANKYRIDDN